MSGLRIYILLLLLFSLSGCSRYYYKPNGVNAPLLTKAKDAHLSVGVASNSDNAKFTDIQASYSPINHLGIIGNFSTYSYNAPTVDIPAGQVDARAHLAELGAGYYYANGDKIKFVFDIYGGFGGGKLQSDVNMNFVRSFIQPGVGLRMPFFELSFNYRLSDIRYSSMNTNGHDTTYLLQQNLIYDNNRRIDNTSYIFAEPAITLRAGYKFIKMQTQYVISNAVTHVPWQYNNSLLNIGLSFELEELLKFVDDHQKKLSAGSLK